MSDAFEKALSDIEWHLNHLTQEETLLKVMEYFKHFHKAALGSRVVLPERKIYPYDSHEREYDPWQDGFFDGFNDCLDQIKLVPLSVDELFPNDSEITIKANVGYKYFIGHRDCFVEGAQWLRESIKKRLAGL